MKGFRQGQVFDYLLTNPGAARSAIMEKFGLNDNSASNVLQRMKVAGIVRREGDCFKLSRWYVCGERPHDGRGQSLGSLKGLKIAQQNWRKGLRAAAVAKGYKPEIVDTPRPPKIRTKHLIYQYGCELERCWSPFSRKQESHDGL